MEVWNKSNRFAQHCMRHVIPSAAGWQVDAAERVWPRKKKKTPRYLELWSERHTRGSVTALNRRHFFLRSAGDHFPLCSSKHRSVDKLILSVKSQRLSSLWPQVILIIVNVTFQLHLGRLYEPYFSGIVLKEMSSALLEKFTFFFIPAITRDIIQAYSTFAESLNFHGDSNCASTTPLSMLISQLQRPQSCYSSHKLERSLL